MKLEITNRILKDTVYRSKMQELAVLEADRIFCRHDIGHCLDVARIAMILCTEKGILAEPDMIYSAALLHDIGRCEEYISGEPHDTAGLKIAAEILDRTGCSRDMKDSILELIAFHRNEKNGNVLGEIFYAADKKSRLCFNCSAQDKCKWQPDRRNNNIEV